MNTIVLISERGHCHSAWRAYLETLFPECHIEVVSLPTGYAPPQTLPMQRTYSNMLEVPPNNGEFNA